MLPPCQGWGREFESHRPLQFLNQTYVGQTRWCLHLKQSGGSSSFGRNEYLPIAAFEGASDTGSFIEAIGLDSKFR